MSAPLVRAMRHVGIVARKVEPLLEFYRDVLGMEVVKDYQEDGPYIQTLLGLPPLKLRMVKLVAPDQSMIELLHFFGASPENAARGLHRPGLTHVAFTVDDVEDVERRLRARGVRFVSAPQTSPDGYAKVVFCQDPEGNFLELVEVQRPT